MSSQQSFSKVPSLQTIAARLPQIFPEGIEHRNYLIRDLAAKTVFVMFYAGAVEGLDRWIRPNQVTIMTDEQAAKTLIKERLAWVEFTLSTSKAKRDVKGWYATDTREPIRDETIRFGLLSVGAATERKGLAVTSSSPRYALRKEFAALFDESLSGKVFETLASEWREKHLSKSALARQELVRRGVAVVADADKVRVAFPNGEARLLSPGPSSIISKAVVEKFAHRFLYEPAVLWLSESSNKVVARDDELAKKVGINIQAEKNLPDIILVETGGKEILFVFVEVVATDGPINQRRRDTLLDITLRAGYDQQHVAFLTAFEDRAASAYKKAVSELAWGSFVWFMSEPDHIVVLSLGGQHNKKLLDLLIIS